MPEDQKSGFSEAVETGASAAHTIRGAIKTGKAISSAAKGAAAGGPYGAVAGAVWAGRKHIGKIIVAVIALLMLPVLFVLMLPGLIFGGLTNAFSPSDPEIPILNSETAIIENANEITFTLNGILGEALDDVLARIEADFAASGADHMEVKNAYSGGPIYNANLFISQYCAAKDKDFESISLNDLAATLRENKQHLYSYTSKQEIRESTVTDPETGEETTEPETWMVYTVRYNGESYFSDVVFQLTDDQKELAADYASNLSLFLGDGLLQNLEAWTGNSITSLGDVTFTDGITPVVYYNQLDERYAGKAYGTDNIGGYGCGPTAMAIVVSSLTDDMVDPVEMAEWSYNNGYWCKSSGSYHALIPAAAGEWGLPVSGCTTAEPQRITDALANFLLVVTIQAAKETSVKIRYCHIMTPLRFIVDWNSLLPIHPPVISGIIVCGLDLKDRCGAIRQFHKVVHISQHPRILWVLEHLFDLVDPISGFPLEYLCYQRLQQMPHFHGNPVALIIFH